MASKLRRGLLILLSGSTFLFITASMASFSETSFTPLPSINNEQENGSQKINKGFTFEFSDSLKFNDNDLEHCMV